MSWMETDPLKERKQFLEDYQRHFYSFTELCQKYGISRKTGYKWKKRFEENGEQGLAEHSKAPHSIPHQTPQHIVDLILEKARQKKTWGPKKILDRLMFDHPEIEQWPARSTCSDILRRHHLTTRRRQRRPRSLFPKAPIIEVNAPHDVWTVDFKGEFKLLNGQYCYPLTVQDKYSRYILACVALPSTRGEYVRPVFERLFRSYGIPKYILSDNGTPFASTAIHGLSQLNIWWLQLGILHKKTQPGCPQQNGTHERMHRVLKEEATIPPARTMKLQQRKFDTFRWEYNHERPHEGIQMKTPIQLFDFSERKYPNEIKEFSYPEHFEVRKVNRDGGFRWHSTWVFLSKALAERHVGLIEIEPYIWAIWAGPLEIGRLDERDLTFYP